MDKKIITVTQLNNFIKDYLENIPILRQVSVKGEISNITLHRTGHIYMTLKDETSLLKAVMFRTDAEKLNFVPKNGDKVIAAGRVSVYPRDGVYQLYVNSLEQDGIGSLYVAFEKLKAKLASEGLFDPARKRRLPALPLSVGIVTAPTGAAIRDMINIAGRRFPGCELVLYPSLVQGAGAPANIIKGINYFNENKRVELIIIGRGGGSAEDLWAFNDEELARVIYKSEIPIVSAVGHETDFTIADFVADLRAPTPSAAVEMTLPDSSELSRKFGNAGTRISSLLIRRLEGEKKLLSLLASSSFIKTPEKLYQDKTVDMLKLSQRLDSAAAGVIGERKKELLRLSSLAGSLNPLGVLKRGYSVAYDKNGAIVTSAGAISDGEAFRLRLSDGCINALKTGEA